MKMKKILSLLLALTMVFALAACGGTTDSTDADDATDAAEAETTYSIGIVQLVQHDALDLATQGFKDALTELLGDSVVFNEQNASGDSAQCATIVNGFVSSNVDLIFANATAALQAAAAATDEIPILGTSITDYQTALELDDYDGTVGGNISGTSDLAPLDQQAEMILELFPEAQNVGLLYCSAEANSVYQIENVEAYLEEAGITCTRYPFSDSNDLATVATAACQTSDVIYVPTDNTAAAATETIDSICRPAGVPIVAGEEGIAEGCGVATLSISYYNIGYKTGEMAYEILVEGADISTMPIQFDEDVQKKYNAEIAEELGIAIPDDYIAIE
ncbi:MAG: ABC transporter substrate-binding protein [Clostridia bacterium]|nr:ABC transporter substrate-binding protein [Clostridia bacterium]